MGAAEAPTLRSGPLDPEEAAGLPAPPVVQMAPLPQLLRFNQRQIEFVFGARRRLGDVFAIRTPEPQPLVITSLPDDVRSLFTAKPEEAPTMAAESPLRPIVGPDSVLTSLGERHMRQRKLLLPPFHGEAIEHYTAAIAEAADREIDSWPLGRPFALAPRMQAITLDVIMSGVFGIDGQPAPRSNEGRLRSTIKSLVDLSTKPIAQVAELMNVRREEPIGITRLGRALLDRRMDAVIAIRRGEDLGERHDILSLLLEARGEEGEPLTDAEIRDELITLVLAGHETTANSLAWAWERLVRTPDAHERLIEAVRASDGAEQIEATIVETMRSRPVVPIVGRRVKLPWRLGEYAVPAETPVLVSILLLHHREDLYPEPFAFQPDRWLDRKPGTYEWLPFGGGIRRCLGAALAMAEQRVVLETMARRLDLEAADPEPERALHRNVTMIPRHGARVVIRSRA
ncbi:MAG TPA: cytochrome P450 [Solirubrobacterales bacterium]|jgi:cytochrome P450|nr:cytochrome P450 [Solirubrobacterales bacterium]